MASLQLFEDSHGASDIEATTRFNILNAVYKALSDYFAVTVHNAHGSHLSPSDSNGSSFSAFLNKLALVCDTSKGTKTITALVTLIGDAGEPVITLTSNYRREHEFREISKFLQDLLHYVEANPGNLNPKPLQKQVLWRILENCRNKMDGFLTKLVEILPPCIEGCARVDEGVKKLLDELQSKARIVKGIQFCEETRDQYLSCCETLIKAIHANKQSPLEQLINRKANDENAAPSDSDSDDWLEPGNNYIWSDLRHCTGRLHSYRQAAEVIIGAKAKWPGFFQTVEVDFVQSGKRPRRQLVKFTGIDEILRLALPGADLNGLCPPKNSDQEVQLRDFIEREWNKANFRLYTHAEMKLYTYLVQQGKTEPKHFWQQNPLIATSKPPCRLCRQYLECAEHDFQIQSTHGNFYAAWRLPDLDDKEEMLGEMLEWMEGETLRLLREGNPTYRRWDSRTETYVPSSLAQRSESGTISSLSHTSAHGYMGQGRPQPRYPPFLSSGHMGLREDRSGTEPPQGQTPSHRHFGMSHMRGGLWPINNEAGSRQNDSLRIDIEEEGYVINGFDSLGGSISVHSTGIPIGTEY